MNRITGFIFCVAAALVYLSASCHPALAQTEEERNYLLMYFKEEDLVVQSATRSPEPASRIAENITVVTAADIKRMNAHTLADVLNTIPGVEVWSNYAPGQQATIQILASEPQHVTVIMDGVVRNYLWSQYAEVGMIPVQAIEKVEIIKGPASSAWGSALGGVVNIITKEGDQANQEGLLSASYGTKDFGDFRAEVRGKKDRTGYYLSAGRLQSRDLAPDTNTDEDNVYAKLSYDITDKTGIQLAFDYERTSRDDDLYPGPPPVVDSDISEHVHTTLTVNSALTDKLDLNIQAWTYNQYQNNRSVDLSGIFVSGNKEKNDGNGVRARLVWKGRMQTLVVGADADNKTDTMDFIAGGKQSIRNEAVYANDTIVLNRLTVTPGLRYDRISSNGDFTSPSLGMTYGLGKDTILRLYAARGFNIPSPAATFGAAFWIQNPGLKVERVWSYQAGMETAVLKHLWMKLSLFRDDIRDHISWVLLPSGSYQVQNIGRERRQGVLIEARTAPVYNTSLSAGAEFNTTKNLITGEHIPDMPTQVYNVGVRYDDRQTFNVLLQGTHINWNSMGGHDQKYHSMLVDFTANKKVLESNDASLEVFASCHNLLNTQQYGTSTHPNASRWYEAGLRYRF